MGTLGSAWTLREVRAGAEGLFGFIRNMSMFSLVCVGWGSGWRLDEELFAGWGWKDFDGFPAPLFFLFVEGFDRGHGDGSSVFDFLDEVGRDEDVVDKAYSVWFFAEGAGGGCLGVAEYEFFSFLSVGEVELFDVGIGQGVGVPVGLLHLEQWLGDVPVVAAAGGEEVVEFGFGLREVVALDELEKDLFAHGDGHFVFGGAGDGFGVEAEAGVGVGGGVAEEFPDPEFVAFFEDEIFHGVEHLFGFADGDADFGEVVGEVDEGGIVGSEGVELGFPLEHVVVSILGEDGFGEGHEGSFGKGEDGAAGGGGCGLVVGRAEVLEVPPEAEVGEAVPFVFEAEGGLEECGPGEGGFGEWHGGNGVEE